MAAFIVRKPNATVTENEVQVFVRELISHYKVPKLVTFFDALPKAGLERFRKSCFARSTGRESTVGLVAPELDHSFGAPKGGHYFYMVGVREEIEHFDVGRRIARVDQQSRITCRSDCVA